MSMFGYTFVTTLMHEMGWPRRSGLLRRETYDVTLIDLATVQMIHWAAALGAGRSAIALQMIAEMVSARTWDGDDAPQISVVIHGSREHWDAKPNADPCEIIKSVPFAKHYDRITPQQLQSADIRWCLEHYVLESCIWGLANRDRFAKWYANYVKQFTSEMPLYQLAGLAVAPPKN